MSTSILSCRVETLELVFLDDERVLEDTGPLVKASVFEELLLELLLKKFRNELNKPVSSDLLTLLLFAEVLGSSPSIIVFCGRLL